MVMEKMMRKWEDAVSPVVGVMLMLVVTIIVAAVVSSFATALTGDVQTGSNAQVELVGVSSGGGVKGTFEQIGIVFENAGGGSLDMRNLKFYVTGIGFTTQGTLTLTYDDPVSLAYVEDSPYLNPYMSRNYVLVTKNATGYRMQKFGGGLTLEELDDPIVEPGERFIVYCEYYSPPSAWATFPIIGLRADRGDSATSTWSSGAVNIDGGAKYTLSDIKTGAVYSSGYLEREDLF